jgi:hypothetical protein
MAEGVQGGRMNNIYSQNIYDRLISLQTIMLKYC